MYKIYSIIYSVKANCILVRYGEIALKGRVTRRSFKRTLVHNIRSGLDEKQISFSLINPQGRVFVQTKQIKKAMDVITKIFGVTSCSPVFEMDLDLEQVSKAAFELVDESIQERNSFALRVNRSGSHEFTSQDLAVNIGAYIQNHKDFQVDLTNPDFELFIEVRDNNAYLFKEKMKGPGGMPLGTQGKILSIIDSPNDILGSWYLMKRGCKTVFFITNTNLTEQLELFLHSWHAPSKIIMKETGSIINQTNQIIKQFKCSAICIGDALFNSSDEIIQKINSLKKHHKIPILTPLISFDYKKIKKDMIEKGIAV